jgi:hypothetical protein
MVVRVCSPSYSGGWGRRVTWAQEFKANIGNIARLHLKNRKEKKKEVEDIHVHSSITHTRQKVEATQVSIKGWKDKQHVVYTYNGILFSHKRKEILTHATTWVNLEDIMLSEISQSQKDKHCMIPFM